MNQAQHPEELLPWYVNRSLSDEEMLGVEAHIKQCDYCQQQISALKHLQVEEKNSAAENPLKDLGLAKLKKQIQDETRLITQKSTWLPRALAASIFVVLLQSAAILHFTTDKPDDYTTLTGISDRAMLQIRFNPQTKEEDIQQLLHSINATIVDGPSAIGLYRIHILSSPSEQELDTLTLQLQAKNALIISVARE